MLDGLPNYIYIYIYIYSQPQTDCFVVSMWLDTQDASSWDRNVYLVKKNPKFFRAFFILCIFFSLFLFACVYIYIYIYMCVCVCAKAYIFTYVCVGKPYETSIMNSIRFASDGDETPKFSYADSGFVSQWYFCLWIATRYLRGYNSRFTLSANTCY